MRRPFSANILRDCSLAFFFFSILNSFSLVSSKNATKKICETKECLSAAQNLKESMDHQADPCEDFYQYACGNWPNLHKNAYDAIITQDTFLLREREITAELTDFIKQNNTKTEPEAVHKARNFFWLCLNDEAYKDKLEQIIPTLQEIGLSALSFIPDEIEVFDYTTALARAAKVAGVDMLFQLSVDFDPHNQTLNRIVLSSIKETSNFPNTSIPLAGNNKISEEQFITEVTERICDLNYTEITSCLEWTGTRDKYKARRNTTIKNMLTQLDEIRQINLKTSDPMALTLKELQNVTDSIAIEVNTTIPKFNWTRYIEERFTGVDVKLNLSDPTKIQILSTTSIEEIARFIYERKNVTQLEFTLWWKVVSKLAPYIDLTICELKNKLNSREIAPSREQICIEQTRTAFKLAVSYVYTTKEKYVKAKTDRIRKMFEHIRESLKQIIEEAPWMDKMTRQRALKKLQSMKSYLVYPNVFIETNLLNDYYKDVNITNNLYDTMISIEKNNGRRTLSMQNQTNNPNEIKADPSDVNAYYESLTNTMIIPAGILGLSFYNNSLRALDYGGIGSIVGHEMTHGFDNTGRKYNETGGKEDWWQNDALNAYKEKAQCFVDAYGNYSTNFNNVTQKIDSVVSLGENIADNGGFKESLLAYRRGVAEYGEEPILPQFENFTHEQLLTLAFANLWCENPIKSYYSEYQAQYDTHSPGAVRVNGVFKNSKEFVDIWKCPKGSKMNPNKEKCSVW